MPTGYTHRVQTGKITNLRDFALVCARAFGALIEMRDDPMDAPMPEKIETSDYNKKELEKARERLVWLTGLTAEQMEHEAQIWYENKVNEYREYRQKIALESSRYAKMLAQVHVWQPPEELSGLKDFMLEQLNDSMEFDCTLHQRDKRRMTGTEWFRKEMDNAKQDIKFYTENYAEDVERAKKCSQWLAALFASLPSPESAEK